MAEPSILGALRDPQFRSDTLRNLVDALNGAKRSLTVGSLGAVGDMGSTLANLVRAGAGTAYHEATGRPIPQALEYRDPARDFGTSASLGNFAESQGWLPPQTYSMPEQAGALLGPIVAMKAPDLAQSTLRGLVSALKSEPSRNAVEGFMNGMGMKPQAIVWHGSPHTFDAFDSSKIGTGEGAQAYGHGLYLAEAPSVAEQYKKALSTFETTIDGVPLTPQHPQFSAGMEIAARGYEKALADARAALASGFVDPIAGRQNLAAIEALKGAKIKQQQRGALYKVDLPDPLIARMLDWDKPLSQQAPEVNKAVREMMDKQAATAEAQRIALNKQYPGRTTHPVLGKIANKEKSALDYRGEAAVSTLVQELGGPEKAAEYLRKQGIPGIRYLDGGSRADGAGTSNFVVFPGEESALTILERNGKPVRR